MNKNSFFNLKKFNLGILQRFAMGAPAWKGREAFMWWNILDIVEGDRNPDAHVPSGDGKETPYQTWTKLLNVNTSLQALKEKAVSQHKSFEELYVNRYAVTPLQAREFFAIVIGYHPEFGGYITSVGPYRFQDKKKQKKDEPFRNLDKLNRFAFFTLRAKSCTPESLVADAAYIRDNKIGRLKELTQLDPQKDFSIKTTFPDPKSTEEGKSIFLESLDSPDADLLFGPSPSSPNGNAFLQVGNKGVSMNASGKYKVMKAISDEYGLQQNFNECIRLVAIKQGITPEQLVQDLETGAKVRVRARGPQPDGGKKMIDLVGDMFDLLDYSNLQAVAKKDGWGDILSYAISAVSGGAPEDEFLEQAGLKFESIEKLAEMDSKQKTERGLLSKRLFKEIKKIKNAVLKKNALKAKDSPEVKEQKQKQLDIANSIFMPNINILNKQKAGALIFTPVIQVKNHQKAQIDLRLKILTKAVEQEKQAPGANVDLSAIAASLKQEAEQSSKQGRASFTEWQEQNVIDWIDQIKRELEIEGQNISYTDMYKMVVKKFGAIKSSSARNTYDTWKEAVENFKIFLMAVDSTQQDKATGAKILAPSAMETLKINVNASNNTTWEQLCAMRQDVQLSPEELARIKEEFDSMSAEELAKIQEGAATAGLSEEELAEVAEEMAEEATSEADMAEVNPEEIEEAATEQVKEQVVEEIKEENVIQDIAGGVDPVPAVDQPDFPIEDIDTPETQGELDFPVDQQPTETVEADDVLPPTRALPKPNFQNNNGKEKDITNEVVQTPNANGEVVNPTQVIKPPKKPGQLFKNKIKDPITSSLVQLIKIAKQMENEGNYKDCEEIHKIIRKYI